MQAIRSKGITELLKQSLQTSPFLTTTGVIFGGGLVVLPFKRTFSHFTAKKAEEIRLRGNSPGSAKFKAFLSTALKAGIVVGAGVATLRFRGYQAAGGKLAPSEWVFANFPKVP